MRQKRGAEVPKCQPVVAVAHWPPRSPEMFPRAELFLFASSGADPEQES